MGSPQIQHGGLPRAMILRWLSRTVVFRRGVADARIVSLTCAWLLAAWLAHWKVRCAARSALGVGATGGLCHAWGVACRGRAHAGRALRYGAGVLDGWGIRRARPLNDPAPRPRVREGRGCGCKAPTYWRSVKSTLGGESSRVDGVSSAECFEQLGGSVSVDGPAESAESGGCEHVAGVVGADEVG